MIIANYDNQIILLIIRRKLILIAYDKVIKYNKVSFNRISLLDSNIFAIEIRIILIPNTHTLRLF